MFSFVHIPKISSLLFRGGRKPENIHIEEVGIRQICLLGLKKKSLKLMKKYEI